MTEGTLKVLLVIAQVCVGLLVAGGLWWFFYAILVPKIRSRKGDGQKGEGGEIG